MKSKADKLIDIVVEGLGIEAISIRERRHISLRLCREMGWKWTMCIRPGCDELIIYGKGTGRRSSSCYCSGKCRKAAHRARQ